MASLVRDIDRELTVHSDIEETVFYPWARRLSDDIAVTVDEGLQEHHVAKVLLGEIKDLPVGEDDWVAKVKVLIENVEHHAGEEEEELFPPVRGHPTPTPSGAWRATSRPARPSWAPRPLPTSRT
jgi:hemerythrin superfamily protein